MIVSRHDLDAAHARLRAMTVEPSLGLFGPGSMYWEVTRESIVLLAGGAAALLQLAHPYVAFAVAEHSSTRANVLGRFERTFEHVLAMVFGDLEQALEHGRAVHEIHERIHGRMTESAGRFERGSEYHANDADALLWVHATLVDRALAAYEGVVGALHEPQRERYYEESKRFAYLFGIPESIIPHDFAAFQRYMTEMLASNSIAVSEPARAMADFLLTPGGSWDAPLWHWYRVMTAGFLPARQRQAFGLDFTRGQEVAFRASMRTLGPVYRSLPGSLRFFPEYLDARAQRTGGHRMSDALQRLARSLLARRGR